MRHSWKLQAPILVEGREGSPDLIAPDRGGRRSLFEPQVLFSGLPQVVAHTQAGLFHPNDDGIDTFHEVLPR